MSDKMDFDWGDFAIISHMYECTEVFTVEDMYQAFKKRMTEENEELDEQ